MTGYRLASGGRIDREKTLNLRFDGRALGAHPGDTLASALIASGEVIVARGFKYHRARGIYSAGVEEPNGFVHLRDGARHEPNARATTTEAFDGLNASSQNAWPDVRLDFGAVTGYLSPFLSAGFYYKTFVGPPQGTRFWMLCERFIRKAAGMGRALKRPDPDSYEKVNAFCDLLVIGGGAAGLSAALTAGQAGADVVLVEQDFALGGSLLSHPVGAPSDGWLQQARAALHALPNVRILTGTTAFGAYDQDVYGLIEHVSDHLKTPEIHQPRQRYWLARARQAVLATGAIASIQVEVPKLVRISLIHDQPSTPPEAQFSLPFAAACAVLNGAVRLEDLTADYIAAPQVTALMSKARIVEAADLSDAKSIAHHPESARVTLTLTNGAQRSGFCGEAYGMPGNPLTDQDISQKFDDCLRFANLASTVTNITKTCILPVAHDLLEQIVTARAPGPPPPGGYPIPQA